MKVAVWDTYVTRKDGTVMHFDILVPEESNEVSTIYQMGEAYLSTKGETDQRLTTEKCNYCHQEIVSGEILKSINDKGYYIIEMDGCE